MKQFFQSKELAAIEHMIVVGIFCGVLAFLGVLITSFANNKTIAAYVAILS